LLTTPAVIARRNNEAISQRFAAVVVKGVFAFVLSFHRSIVQSLHHPQINQSTNQPIHKSTNSQINQSTNQPINPIIHSFHHSIAPSFLTNRFKGFNKL
jgi:hypothetical protein